MADDLTHRDLDARLIRVETKMDNFAEWAHSLAAESTRMRVEATERQASLASSISDLKLSMTIELQKVALRLAAFSGALVVVGFIAPTVWQQTRNSTPDHSEHPAAGVKGLLNQRTP